MKRLPRKLSALIRVALDDLEKCEADPRYVIDMRAWHEPQQGKCYVCMAGAVMAQSLGADPEQYSSPEELADPETKLYGKLMALDSVRLGGVHAALRNLGQPTTALPKSVCKLRASWVSYRDDPEQFKANMRQLANLLEQEGL